MAVVNSAICISAALFAVLFAQQVLCGTYIENRGVRCGGGTLIVTSTNTAACESQCNLLSTCPGYNFQNGNCVARSLCTPAPENSDIIFYAKPAQPSTKATTPEQPDNLPPIDFEFDYSATKAPNTPRIFFNIITNLLLVISIISSRRTC